MEFSDAIKERERNRILRYWRYFMLLFKETQRSKYSSEAFTLLAQYHFLLSPRTAKQLVWIRTINVHGHSRKNI